VTNDALRSGTINAASTLRAPFYALDTIGIERATRAFLRIARMEPFDTIVGTLQTPRGLVAFYPVIG
jgi:hypothetical protein